MQTLVYGAGDVGAQVLRTIGVAPDGLGMRVVGLLDDDRVKRDQVLRGDSVLGSIGELAEVARVTGRPPPAHRHPDGLGRGRPAQPSMTATELGLETRTAARASRTW